MSPQPSARDQAHLGCRSPATSLVHQRGPVTPVSAPIHITSLTRISDRVRGHMQFVLLRVSSAIRSRQFAGGAIAEQGRMPGPANRPAPAHLEHCTFA